MKIYFILTLILCICAVAIPLISVSIYKSHTTPEEIAYTAESITETTGDITKQTSVNTSQ